MLIRAVTKADIPAWLAIAHERDAVVNELTADPATFWKGFTAWAERKVQRNEAFMAADRITSACLGVVTFSQKHNRISFISVVKEADFEQIGGKLMQMALNQLDWGKEITAIVLKSDAPLIKKELALYHTMGFKEHHKTITEYGFPARQLIRTATGDKKPPSFHHDYPGYIRWMEEAHCPICNYETAWQDEDLISKLENCTVYASIKAQGRLWGKCVVVSKKHVIDLYDFTPEELAGFWEDVRKVMISLKDITGAVTVNIELHGNTIPHLHIHLFPRYLDDLHAGKPIDYNIIEPPAYESQAEYDYFVRQMREKLKR